MHELKFPELNKVLFAGRLTTDPPRHISAENSVINLKVTLKRRYKDREGNWQKDTTNVSVAVWNRLAEMAAMYLNKGDAILVEGRLKSRQGKDGNRGTQVEILAQSIQFLDKK